MLRLSAGLGVQACRPADRAMLATPAGAELLGAVAAAMRAEDATAKLAAFGAWCAREFRDSLSDVDGGSAQDAMERLGVIVKRVVTEPCGEGCVCIEYGDFPHECYVFPADVKQAMDSTPNK